MDCLGRGSIRSGHIHPHANVNGHGYYGYPPPLTPGTPGLHHSQTALTAPGPNTGAKKMTIRRRFVIGGLVAIFFLFAAVIGLTFTVVGL